jgi:CPA1 family monovalent cation:H+ antiporter
LTHNIFCRLQGADMTLFSLISLLVVMAALCSYLNYRYVRLPATIGVMVTALVASLLLLTAG